MAQCMLLNPPGHKQPSVAQFALHHQERLDMKLVL
jgi:hypothetical protein